MRSAPLMRKIHRMGDKGRVDTTSKLTDIKEISRYAMTSGEIPEGCDDAAALLFLALRALYREYEKGYITQEQATKEKAKALKAYGGWRFWENVFAETARRNNELDKLKPAIAAGSCEMCKKIVAITEGRTTA